MVQSHGTAAKWYKLAADQGYAEAQFNLGLCYTNGQGVVQSHDTAVKWYKLAADQGNAVAQFYLGVSYEHGLGVPNNAREATALYTQAARQGEPNAIAWFTWRGLPVPTTPCTTMVPASEFLSLTCDECGRRCKPNYCAKCLIANYCSRECKLEGGFGVSDTWNLHTGRAALNTD